MSLGLPKDYKPFNDYFRVMDANGKIHTRDTLKAKQRKILKTEKQYALEVGRTYGYFSSMRKTSYRKYRTISILGGGDLAKGYHKYSAIGRQLDAHVEAIYQALIEKKQINDFKRFSNLAVSLIGNRKATSVIRTVEWMHRVKKMMKDYEVFNAK